MKPEDKTIYLSVLQKCPKSHCKAAWSYLALEAIKDKNWALSILRTRPEWTKDASETELVGVCKLISASVYELTHISYDHYSQEPPTKLNWENLVVELIKKH